MNITAKNKKKLTYIFKLFIVSVWAISNANLESNLRITDVTVLFASEEWYKYWLAIPILFGILFISFNMLVKKWGVQEKPFIVLTATTFIFFNYVTYIHIYIQNHIISHIVLICLYFLMWFFLIRDNYPRLRKSFGELIFIFITLLTLLSLIYCIKTNLQKVSDEVYYNAAQTLPEKNRDIEPAGLPDIYYIVTDAYAGKNSLKRLFSFDNKPFLAELKNKGFYLPEKSYANFPKTEYSISSNLNLSYINDIITIPNFTTLDGSALWLYKTTSRLQKLLENKGYNIFSPNKNKKRSLDISYPKWATFVERTPLVKWLENIEGFNLFKIHKESILTDFKQLHSVAKIKSSEPKFSFYHFVSPHTPFIFDENGESLEYPKYVSVFFDGADLQNDYKKHYVGQLKFINKKLLSAIDTILESATRPTVILLLGDHGSRSHTYWDSVDKTDLDEAYETISAVYFSDGNYQELYPDISPVNIMRLTARKYLGVNTPNIEDKYYYIHPKEPFTFHLITDKLTGGK
jgi:hypothetical protein